MINQRRPCVILLILVLSLLKNTDAIVFCNRHLFTNNCPQLSMQDCDMYFIQTGNNQFVNCNWNITSGTCATGTQTCKPSCFVNANNKVANCSTVQACNQNNFIGGYGNSHICIPYSTSPGSSTCQPSGCDWTCTGMTLMPDCASGSKYTCSRLRLLNSTGDYECRYINGACIAKDKCIPICSGSYFTTNCSTISFGNCGSYYTTVGSSNYECIIYGSSCDSGFNYPTESSKCYVQLPINSCTGAPSGSNGCVYYSYSPSACNGRWQISAYTGKRQCKYIYGLNSNSCQSDNVCG